MAEKYLHTFISEIRGYCEIIADYTRALRAPQVAAEDVCSAAAGLTRLFHTIAGLSGSLEIADFAGLAEALETCLLSISTQPGAAESIGAGTLVDLLDFATAYLAHRVQRMEDSGQFQPPAPDDEEPLRLLEDRLWQLGNQLEPPEEEEMPPAEPLSAEDIAILQAFNESDLAAADQAALPDAFDQETGREAAEAPEAAAQAESLVAEEIPPDMLELFLVETRDDISLIQDALARLETPDERAAAVQEMRHVAHKIKGAASTLNLQVVAGLSHCLEDILDLLRSRRLEYAPAVVEALMHGVIELEAALIRPAAQGAESAAGLERLRAQYEALLAESLPERAGDLEATLPDSRRLATALRQPGAAAEAFLPDQSGVYEALRERAGGLIGREHSLRVEVSRLDQLMGLVGELASNRANTEQVRQGINESLAEVRRAVQKLNHLVNQLDEEAPMRYAPGGAEAPRSLDVMRALTAEEAALRAELDLESFESEHDHLLRALREGVNDIATVSDGLQRLLLQLHGLAEAQDGLTSAIQRDITHLRLVPIGQVFPRLQLTVRMIAQEQNKQINFLPTGAATEIDRDIIEAITGPLVQLVRNCAVHGIESVEERRARGKPDVGTITLHAYYTGNEISIEVGDDGSGINYHRLIDTAVALGKLSPEEAERLEPEQALNLMLLPDISTSPQVTTVAGRGVGMDMVRTVVEGLKGTLHIHSTPGEGTSFHIRLPISLGILHALFVRAGGQIYAVPMSSVARIWQPGDQQTPDTTAFFRLSDTLGIAPHQPDEGSEETDTAAPQVALIVPLRQRQIGIYVDEVLTDREVVIKRLPPHLHRRGVRGVILNPTGELLLLLDLPELAYHALSSAQAERLAAAPAEPTPAAPITSGPRVLVVDDSLFMRRTLELQLTRAGYRVTAAKDGLEALHLIREDRPQLVLLDIEMPQLDGYGLLSILRAQPRYNGLPVAVLTSRAADKYRQHALDLGANAYLVKPCPHDVLLKTVAKLASHPHPIGQS